jgi:hypothetical protein
MSIDMSRFYGLASILRSRMMLSSLQTTSSSQILAVIIKSHSLALEILCYDMEVGENRVSDL